MTGSYTITWHSPENNGSKTGITGTSITINGLLPNTLYNFNAQNSVGDEQVSDPVSVVTGLFEKIFFKQTKFNKLIGNNTGQRTFWCQDSFNRFRLF